jgi:hypothetical protein
MDGIKDGNIVRAAGSFMLRLVVSLLSVLMARFGVHPATAKPRNLAAEDLDVVQIVVISPLECGPPMSNEAPICNGCKSLQIKSAHKPRTLVRLPVEVTQDSVFNNKGLAVWLCAFCDEHELKAALAAQQKRIDNK